MHGRFDCVKYLLDHCGIDVNEPSSDARSTALHYCVSESSGNSSIQCLKVLLERGANQSTYGIVFLCVCVRLCYPFFLIIQQRRRRSNRTSPRCKSREYQMCEVALGTWGRYRCVGKRPYGQCACLHVICAGWRREYTPRLGWPVRTPRMHSPPTSATLGLQKGRNRARENRNTGAG